MDVVCKKIEEEQAAQLHRKVNSNLLADDLGVTSSENTLREEGLIQPTLRFKISGAKFLT